MSFLRLAMAGDYESEIAKEGAYTLQCTAADIKEPKPGKDRSMIQLVLRIVGTDKDAKLAPIYENLVLPGPDDDPESQAFQMSMMRIKRAVTAFKVKFNEEGFDYKDFENKTAKNISVVQEEIIRNDRPTGEFRNTVKWPAVKGEKA